MPIDTTPNNIQHIISSYRLEMYPFFHCPRDASGTRFSGRPYASLRRVFHTTADPGPPTLSSNTRRAAVRGVENGARMFEQSGRTTAPTIMVLHAYGKKKKQNLPIPIPTGQMVTI